MGAVVAATHDETPTDVVCVGHVHIPHHRTMVGTSGQTVHYVSTGSVGKPKDGDPRACWVELVLGDADSVGEATGGDGAPAGLSTTHVGTLVHRIDYDVESVAHAMAQVGLPATLAEALRVG